MYQVCEQTWYIQCWTVQFVDCVKARDARFALEMSLLQCAPYVIYVTVTLRYDVGTR